MPRTFNPIFVKSIIDETADPIIVSAPCKEIYKRYLNCKLPEERLVTHILIMDTPSKYAKEFTDAVNEFSKDIQCRGTIDIRPMTFCLPIPNHLNKSMKERA